jgi:predicted CXXCH cytochrome family protein
LGTVGGQCIFLCHSGKGILPETDTLVPEAGPSVNTDDYTTRRYPDYTSVYFTRSHGRRPGELKDGAGNPVAWPPAGMAWQGYAGGPQLECTSCHSVHDGRNAPFLLYPLAAEYPKMDGFCDRCHLERATNNLTGPPDGSHTVDFPLDNEVSS